MEYTFHLAFVKNKYYQNEIVRFRLALVKNKYLSNESKSIN